MLEKPLIGITTGEIRSKEHPWSPLVYGQSYTYSDAIIRAGGIPVLLPLTEKSEIITHMCKKVDGILFAGGNDVDPRLYGQEPHETVTDVSVLRDSAEMLLMKLALEEGKPILGICRGMQLLNIAQGGTIYQHIPADLPHAQNHSSSTTAKDLEHIAHLLRVKKDSKFAEMLGAESVRANTHHHQAIKELGKGLCAVAWAEDDVIEAIEGDGVGYCIGVQPHPESLEAKAEPLWRGMFESFVKASQLSSTNMG